MKLSQFFATAERRDDARRRAASAWLTPLELGTRSIGAGAELGPAVAAPDSEGNDDAWTDTASGRVGDRLDPVALVAQDVQAALALESFAAPPASPAANGHDAPAPDGGARQPINGGAAGARTVRTGRAVNGRDAPASNGHDTAAANGSSAASRARGLDAEVDHNGAAAALEFSPAQSLTLMEVGAPAQDGALAPSQFAGEAETALAPLEHLPTPQLAGPRPHAPRSLFALFRRSRKSDHRVPSAPVEQPARIEPPAYVDTVAEPKDGKNGSRIEGLAPVEAGPRLNARVSRSSSAARPRAEIRADPGSAGRIGAILVAAQRMSADDAQRVAQEQASVPEPFGEVAIRLGLASQADVHFALARQFSLPRLESGDASIDPEVIAAFDPAHPLVEHLRGLRNQIALRALDATPGARSIAIVGAERRIGRSYVAANLATVFAQLGTRTLLIDADLAAPRQHELFRLGNRIGLSSVIAGRADLSAACPVPGLPGFAVMPAGPTPPNPHDLIARPSLARFLRRCEQDFDVVLVDTPAWNAGTGARMAAAAAGAALLLVQSGRTAADDASAIAREFAGANTRLVGAVLNRPR